MDNKLMNEQNKQLYYANVLKFLELAKDEMKEDVYKEAIKEIGKKLRFDESCFKD